MASVAAYVKNGEEMIRSKHRHEAQVDAQIKARLAACGQEDLYNPPDSEDEMSPTFINCPINSEKSIETIMQGLMGITESENQPKTPEKPAEPVEQPKRRTPRWLMPLLGAGIAAGGVGLGAWLSDSGSNQQDAYNIKAIDPYLTELTK